MLKVAFNDGTVEEYSQVDIVLNDYDLDTIYFMKDISKETVTYIPNKSIKYYEDNYSDERVAKLRKYYKEKYMKES